MNRAFVAAAVVLIGGIAVAQPVPVAPAPRPAKPDLSLIAIEDLPGIEGAINTRRVLSVGFRNGAMLPSETVWEGDQRFLGHFGGHRLVGDRYLVTNFCGVIDLQARKVINDTESGELHHIDGTKVIYWTGNTEKGGIYSFDLATSKLTRLGNRPERKSLRIGVLSPDFKKEIETGPVADELILHCDGEKPKSLGKGFRIDIGTASSVFGPSPILWLDNDTILTQRGNGKLVTVDLTGKIIEVMTIKDAPKNLVSAPRLYRDGGGAIVYTCGAEAYKIDVAKKTAEKYEWHDLGHGFEASWEEHEKFGTRLRHKGKEIGSFHCWWYTAKTAPGYIAIEAQYGQERRYQPECVAIWSEARGEWETIKMYPNAIVGWVK